MNIILLVNDQYDDQVFESEAKSIEHQHENGKLLANLIKCLLLFEVLYVCDDLFIIFIWLILIRRRIIRII